MYDAIDMSQDYQIYCKLSSSKKTLRI